VTERQRLPRMLDRIKYLTAIQEQVITIRRMAREAREPGKLCTCICLHLSSKSGSEPKIGSSARRNKPTALAGKPNITFCVILKNVESACRAQEERVELEMRILQYKLILLTSNLDELTLAAHRGTDRAA
jgi:hypothetical protein